MNKWQKANLKTETCGYFLCIPVPHYVKDHGCFEYLGVLIAIIDGS